MLPIGWNMKSMAPAPWWLELLCAAISVRTSQPVRFVSGLSPAILTTRSCTGRRRTPCKSLPSYMESDTFGAF